MSYGVHNLFHFTIKRLVFLIEAYYVLCEVRNFNLDTSHIHFSLEGLYFNFMQLSRTSLLQEKSTWILGMESKIQNRKECKFYSRIYRSVLEYYLHLSHYWIKPCCHKIKHWYIILIRSNKMQQYASIYLLQNYSTCFVCPSHPSSGVHKTVTAASGTGHSTRVTTFLECGLIRPRWRKVVTKILWPVPETAVTALCNPDDGCDEHPKHVE